MTSSFAERLAGVAAYPDKYFAAFLLDADPLANKLTVSQRHEIINDALACGTNIGEQLRSCWAGQSPSEIAGRLGIDVKAATMRGGRQVLSRYEPGRRAVLLNRELLVRLEQEIAAMEMDCNFGQIDASEIIIAHELFHHIEAGDKELFPRLYRITLWRIGPLRYRSRVPAASEIAAMACSKALCRLPANPLLLEAILLKASGDQAGDWLARLERTSAEIMSPPFHQKRS